MSTLQQRSALSHRTALASGASEAILGERPHDGKLILRGALDLIGAACAQVLGVPMPGSANHTASGQRGTVLWLGPDEWLLVTAPGAEAVLASDLRQALLGKHHQIADVTDYYTTIELSGSRSRDMLMKIATADFHPKVFKAGMGMTTNLARTVAWLRQTRDDRESGGPAFDIVIRISMADYLWCLLAEAGREWGLPAQEPKGKVKLHLPHFEADGSRP